MGGFISPAQDAGMGLESFLGEFAAAISIEPPPILYHYTSVNSLRSILLSRILRAMPMLRLNDFAEGRFAASVFRATLDQEFAREPFGEFYEVLAYMRHEMNRSLDLSNVYSISFNSDGDDKFLWRLYGDIGRGISIGIPVAQYKKWTDSPVFAHFWQCQYGEATVSDMALKALEKAKELFAGSENPLPFGNQYYSQPNEFALEFLKRISPFSTAFKPQAWAGEAEWRFVVVESPYEHIQEFIELPISDSKDVDVAICFGPSCSAKDCDEITSLISAIAPKVNCIRSSWTGGA